jgi:ATP-dependent protease ClpP protease subunit
MNLAFSLCAAIALALLPMMPGLVAAQERPEEDAAQTTQRCDGWFYHQGKVDLGLPRAIGELSNCGPDPKRFSMMITSDGGSVMAGVASFELMRNLTKQGNEFTTVAVGTVGSAAILPFLAGTDRVVTCYSHLFLHPISTGLDETRATLAEINELAALGKANADSYVRIVSDRTGLSPETVMEMMRETTVIGPQDALDMGFTTRMEKGACL